MPYESHLRDDAKDTLRHYFQLVLGELSSDQHREIGDIVDNIINAAKSEMSTETRAYHPDFKGD